MCHVRDSVLFKNPFLFFPSPLWNTYIQQTYRKKPVKKNMEEPPAGKEVKNGFSKAYFAATNGVINKKAQ